MMNKAAFGLAALAVSFVAGPALAEPETADLWIGLEGSSDGFLLDTSTGDLWMTGICLKPLKRASQLGNIWTSRTAEMVSVGRAMVLLDQTFTLDVSPDAPRFRVDNPQRGGGNDFPAVIDPNCLTSEACKGFRQQEVCDD